MRPDYQRIDGKDWIGMDGLDMNEFFFLPFFLSFFLYAIINFYIFCSYSIISYSYIPCLYELGRINDIHIHTHYTISSWISPFFFFFFSIFFVRTNIPECQSVFHGCRRLGYAADRYLQGTPSRDQSCCKIDGFALVPTEVCTVPLPWVDTCT